VRPNEPIPFLFLIFTFKNEILLLNKIKCIPSINKMLERISFNLSRGYLSKTILAEKKDEMDDGIVSGILSELSSLDGDKIECYYGSITSGTTDSRTAYDYLILYKFYDGFKPVVVKNGSHQLCRPSKWFENYYEEEVSDEEYNKRFGITECDDSELTELEKTRKQFEHKYFGHANYKVNELLELVCESSREKFHEFLKKKYSDFIRQEILMF
jgi:hypothetical protein